MELERLKINLSYLLRRALITPKPDATTFGILNHSMSSKFIPHAYAVFRANEKVNDLEISALKKARQEGLEAVSYEVFRRTLKEEESQIPPVWELYQKYMQKS